VAPRDRAVKFRDDKVVAFLLVAGLFLPTSVNGEARVSLVGIGFLILLLTYLFLIWNHGARLNAVAWISGPILMVLSLSTLIVWHESTFPFGWGLLATYSTLATLLALNLREVRPGRLVSAAFFLTNIIWIVCGAAVLVGNEWVGGVLTAWYSDFYPELLPGMLSLHKPIFTFGTHSLAGVFTYLFFWLNWETFKVRRSIWSLVFALSQLVLLLGLTSYTSFAFLALGITQVTVWLWKNNRPALLALAACLVVAGFLAGGLVVEQVYELWQNPQISAVVFTNESGPLGRYRAGGFLSGTIGYLWNHPFSPIGLTLPSFLFLGDSGPLQYLVRGSVPLLFLIYFGLYKFFRYNSPSRNHALLLFLVCLAFETGFDALPYFRTQFLLPFFVVYLKEIEPPQSMDRV